MRRRSLFPFLVGCGLLSAAPGFAAPEIADARLRERVDALAATTLEGGGGWEAYARLLHPRYSRWAMGEQYEGREAFVKNVRAWWEYGMRVATRRIELVGVDVAGEVAILRFQACETFAGPGDAADAFCGYVTNVWKREDGDWWLLSADIAKAPGAVTPDP